MKAKQKLDLFIKCPCGSMAGIFEGTKGYYCHCLHCGKMTFFTSETIIEKVKAGSKIICEHHIELKNCKGGGKTSWCPIYRIRIFQPPTKAQRK